MKVVTVIGARPQFIKAAPLSRELRQYAHEVLVHTGQHYDYEMSDIFFEELHLPQPDYHLGIGSGSHGAQTGAMLAAIESVLQAERPDAVLVYGDTNSTLAGALAAAKLHIPIGHIEAGLRSFNRAMPEEINRVLTDHLATWLFAPAEGARDQLSREGITRGVHIVGDIMYDAIRLFRERADHQPPVATTLGLEAGSFYLATVHRAENTERRERLEAIFAGLGRLDRRVVLPLHPRTRKMLAEHGLCLGANMSVIEPVGYLDMLWMTGAAACVLTDSGGLQKEAYYLETPCVTLRDETEWIETVEAGWNTLWSGGPEALAAAIERVSEPGKAHPHLYGAGDSARQIVSALLDGQGKG